jgi:hypothetical protein
MNCPRSHRWLVAEVVIPTDFQFSVQSFHLWEKGKGEKYETSVTKEHNVKEKQKNSPQETWKTVKKSFHSGFMTK